MCVAISVALRDYNLSQLVFVEHNYDFLCEIRYYHREYHCHLRYTDIIPYGYLTYLLGGCSNSYVATEVATLNG